MLRPGRRCLVNVVKLRSVDSFAYLPKGGLEPFLERGVVERHREKAAS